MRNQTAVPHARVGTRPADSFQNSGEPLPGVFLFYAGRKRGNGDDRVPGAGLIDDRGLSGVPYSLRERDSVLAGAASHPEGCAPRDLRLCFQAAMLRLNAISSRRV